MKNLMSLKYANILIKILECQKIKKKEIILLQITKIINYYKFKMVKKLKLQFKINKIIQSKTNDLSK